MRVLIAERDDNERIGIEWLIKTYSLPVNEVMTAGSMKEMLSILEKAMPDILYIELDMIPVENWPLALRYAKSFCKKVIAVTAEATFARAKQAIELQSADLLVKPIEPSKVKFAIQKAIAVIAEGNGGNAAAPLYEEGFAYRSLFLKEEGVIDNGGIILLQTENQQKTSNLVQFLKEYPFFEQPFLFPLTNMVVCAFPNPDRELEEEAKKLIREWEGEPLAAVVIPPGSGKTSLYEMYHSARRLLEVTFFIGYHQVILENADYGSWREIDPFLTPAEQREWIDMLNRFDRNGVKQWLHNEFLHIETPFPNPEMLRTRLTSILAQVRRFMKTYRLDGQELEGRYMKVFAEILYNPVLYRIVQDMVLFLYEVVEKAEKAETLAKKDVIEKGIHYIEEHYADQDLSLEKVTSAIGISYAYFSHLLMKKHGKTFRQLVTETRVKAAKLLLAKSELSIKEIAFETGFRDANYFAKSFKNLTGMTPREYRTQSFVNEGIRK